jgi:hypothetical protein
MRIPWGKELAVGLLMMILKRMEARYQVSGEPVAFGEIIAKVSDGLPLEAIE